MERDEQDIFWGSRCLLELRRIVLMLAKEQLRENIADALIPLCTDSSDKARASGLRAVGCMAELGLKPQQVQELADLQLRFCRMFFYAFMIIYCMHLWSPFCIFFSPNRHDSHDVKRMSKLISRIRKNPLHPVRFARFAHKAHGGSAETTSQVSVEWLPFSWATGSSNGPFSREEVDGSSLWLVCQDDSEFRISIEDQWKNHRKFRTRRCGKTEYLKHQVRIWRRSSPCTFYLLLHIVYILSWQIPDTSFRPFLGDLLKTENLKVRIQAALALQQAMALWLESKFGLEMFWQNLPWPNATGYPGGFNAGSNWRKGSHLTSCKWCFEPPSRIATLWLFTVVGGV